MKLKTVINKNKYPLFIFAVLAMLSLVYDGFESATALVCRLLVCIAVSVFFSPLFNTKKSKNENTFFAAFGLLSIISCNIIFITEDVHILLSVFCFFVSLFFAKKIKFLTPIFARLCVAVQPLTILFFVPAIIITLAIKKQKFSAILTAAISVAVFVLTKIFEHNEFYSDQFSSYPLSVHLIHFSAEHLKILSQFLLCSIPILILVFACLIRLFLHGKKLESILIFASLFISLFAFALSENTQTVFMVLIPAFAIFICLKDDNGFAEIIDEIGAFFSRHLLLFCLLVAWTAAYPLILGQVPYGSDFFSKMTYIIFRQE